MYIHVDLPPFLIYVFVSIRETSIYVVCNHAFTILSGKLYVIHVLLSLKKNVLLKIPFSKECLQLNFALQLQVVT